MMGNAAYLLLIAGPQCLLWCLTHQKFLVCVCWIELEPNDTDPCWELKGCYRGMNEWGGKECPHLARVPPVLWAGGHGRAARHFPLGPGWASKPLTPLDGGWTRGSPQNQGAPGRHPVAPGLQERGLRERGSHADESKRSSWPWLEPLGD